jgi:hypothetical protein
VPFTHLLWKCLLPDQARVREGGKTAHLDRKKGECVLAFQIDQADFRKAFDLKDKPVCDGLFFFKTSATVPVLFLVELKGSDFARAVEQIESTLQLLKKKLAQYPSKYRAVVVTDRRVPTQQKGRFDEFQKRHKTALRVSRDGDLRPLL